MNHCEKCGIEIRQVGGLAGYCDVCEAIITSTIHSPFFREAQMESRGIKIFPRPASALVIEDNAQRQLFFFSQLRPNVKVVYRVHEALALLRENFYGLVALDWDLPWRATGLANINTAPIAAYIAKHRPELQTLVHSRSSSGVLALRQMLPEAVVQPFGSFEFSQQNAWRR